MDAPSDLVFDAGTKFGGFFSKTNFLSVLTTGFDTFEKGLVLGLDDQFCKFVTLVLQL